MLPLTYLWNKYDTNVNVCFAIITSLVKEVMFLVVLICLSVFLLATLLKELRMACDEILLRGFGREGLNRTSDLILVVIWITLPTAHSEIRPLITPQIMIGF